MQSLHDNHDGGGVRVIEPGRDGFTEPLNRAVSLRLTAGAFHAVGVVDDDPIPARAGNAAGGHGHAEAGRGILELGFLVLIPGQHNGGPALAIPVGGYQPAHAVAVAGSDLVQGVRGANIPEMRHAARAPFPRGPEHRHRKAFHGPGRDIDKEPVVIAAVRYRFEMLTNSVDMPAVDVGLPGLDKMPGQPDERRQRLPAISPVQRNQAGLPVDIRGGYGGHSVTAGTRCASR